ncbi:murein biosynthesis integral membrane protein MurJ [Williamsia sp. CHRR-6]|uniref:murein biosynthesis integral membrane protein MurJ n=1 Tax=Williamsia sp. CHRR-6 TaxID=2835871 RepID=UPI001BD9F74D|nr:murein biosynthesis integral membrane protein MurJ [Williamsia sp. CHRR-6]MBT0567754.1 murein biosynthesis integral membrane protein MurJ [Williamsia sp. CHRR-6]
MTDRIDRRGDGEPRPTRAAPRRIPPGAAVPRNPERMPPGQRAAPRRIPPGPALPQSGKPRAAQPRVISTDQTRRIVTGEPPAPPPSPRPRGVLVDDRPTDIFAAVDSGPARQTDESVLRTSGSIALATLISRITGFVRTILVLAMLGSAVASSFQAAYVLPSIVAEVVLGAVLTAIVIPVLVRAEAEDGDGGEGFINRIFTLALLTLGVATVLAMIGAPLLTYLNLGDGQVNRPLATALAYLLLPEVLFYGMSALFTAILNMKGHFRPGAWAPVLNNVVQISTLVVYALVPGEISLNPVRMGDAKLLVLGLGTTLGVVAQACILLPALRRAGVRLRLRWGLDDRLRSFGRMAGAIVVYVAVLQVGFFITYRIASSADSSGVSIYATHWQLLQLPYGVLGVTILTAIMPRLSRNAAADDTHSVVDDLSLSTRLTMVALVPIITFMTFFGPAIAIAVFNFGRFTLSDADQLGSVLSWGAFTIIPYSMTLVQLRVFYAREDAWTPTAIAVGITVVKVISSYAGAAFLDGPAVVRWLALSNGLGYLVGAIVGHLLLRRRLGPIRMTNVTRTTTMTVLASIAGCGVVWGVAQVSGLHRFADEHGKIGSLAYLMFTALVALGLVYTALVLLRIPDVIAVSVSIRRMLGRFIPGIAPTREPPNESTAELTVSFPRITGEEDLPYSGQVQVLRRFDSGTERWQAYSVYTGGAVGRGAPAPARDLRYRRRGVDLVGTDDVDSGGVRDLPGLVNTNPRLRAIRDDAPPPAPISPAPPPPAATESGARGPRLVPGAAVAGGRYRLLTAHGGARGLRFWRARDINLDRDVALTFVDAEQIAPAPDPDTAAGSRGEGPQAVLSRTLRLGRVNSPGIARVLDVVRGSSGGIVVAEWVDGSSLTDVARTNPSPIGAARAVRALAAAAEAAHRTGSSLSIDHPDRIRVSREGNAVLAFPGTLAGDDKSTDVRGLGAVLYALLLAQWPLEADGSIRGPGAQSDEPVGGLPPAALADTGVPKEPRAVRADVPFEISAVAARALQGNSGIRTAATIQHVLDQATVVDQKTDLMPVVGDETRLPPASNVRAEKQASPQSRRRLAIMAGVGLLALLIVIALVVALTGGSDSNKDSTPDIDSIITSGAAAAGASAAPPAAGAPVSLRSVTVVDYSTQTPDSSVNVGNTITGRSPAWRTDAYRGGPRFGNLKNGLGLMFALSRPAAVKTITITTPTPGVALQIRLAPSATARLDDTTSVAQVTLERESTTVTIASPQPSPYVLLWITSLPQSGRAYQGSIGQVSVSA